MDPKVRRAALRAAAKTTIALSLMGGTLALAAGCASSHRAPVSSDAGPAVADGGALADDAGPGALGDDGGAAPPCDERLAALELTDRGDLWTTRFASDDVRNDPRVGECCVELDERAHAEGTVGIDPALGMACCDVVVFAQGLASWSPLGCTPWGPPCPPEAPV